MRPDLERRLQLYRAGKSDGEIAAIDGVKPNTIVIWRRVRGLPANPAHRGLEPSAAARRMLLYALGWGDRAIGREMGVDRASVREWRHRKRLAPNFTNSAQQRRNPRPTLVDVFARVRRSMARWLPRDVADDAIGDLVRDVLDGTIPLDRIEAEAKRYGNRVLDRFASRYGPRSLDEELGDSDGFRMIDMIRDDRSSSWLEEMGATVW